MNIQSASEIIVGLCLIGQADPKTLTSSVLAPPYNDMAERLRKGDTETDLVDRFDAGLVATCKQAARSVQSISADWPEVARRARDKFDIGSLLGKSGKMLMDGQDIDDVTVIKEIGRLRRGESLVTAASQTEPELDHFWPIGWKPLDDTVGGLPKSGLTVLAALPKTGKTTLLLLWALILARAKRYTMIFTFEMKKAQIVGRLKEIGAKAADLKYILLVDNIMDIDAIGALATRYDSEYDLALIGADSADLVVRGKIEETSMTAVYKGGAEIAHDLSKPFVLIGHFNDAAYKAGIPRVDHVRYSRMAIGFASMIALGYNPNNIWATSGEDQRLPIFPGDSYLIVGASRWGFGKHERVGAIRTSWAGATGWGSKLKDWHDLGDNY